MYCKSPEEMTHFFVAGINYKKADVAVRSMFAIGDEQYRTILQSSPGFGIHEFFIVSTCNRTEIYGFAESAGQLIELLCSQTEGNVETFKKIAYIKSDSDVIEHLLHVGAGLDSQILGDYEIIGQIKKAAKTAKEFGRIDAFTERLVNCMLQSSKNIKNKTNLSGGTVSVSFAAVQYIKNHIKSVRNKKILLIGTGKFGRITCKNLVDYLGTSNITLINRTEEKASMLAVELGLQAASVDQLEEQISLSDIILVATNAVEPTILRSQLEGPDQKLVIDLSIPHNVEPDSETLENVTLVNVDELSKMKDETLAKREAEIPKAKEIIREHIHEFIDWYAMRKHVPVLRAVKSKLKEIHTSPLFIPLFDHQILTINPEEKIQRVVNGVASKMKEQDQKGCYYIEAINEFLATGA